MNTIEFLLKNYRNNEIIEFDNDIKLKNLKVGHLNFTILFTSSNYLLYIKQKKYHILKITLKNKKSKKLKRKIID